jgi:hypothetical protein
VLGKDVPLEYLGRVAVELEHRRIEREYVVVGDFGRARGDGASYRLHVGGKFSGAPAGTRPHASTRIAARERAVVVLMDKDFAPFAQLAQPFGFASGPSLAESKLLSCHKTADRHFPKCSLRSNISERKQKHFLERVPESVGSSPLLAHRCAFGLSRFNHIQRSTLAADDDDATQYLHRRCSRSVARACQAHRAARLPPR